MQKKLLLVFNLILLIVILSACSTAKDEPENKSEGSSVKIYRDEFGVPHIYADKIDNLYKAYGYVMAQDRLFQLEMFKRANDGTAAAVFGEEYLEHDEKVRRDGYSNDEIEKMIGEMEAFPKEVIDNFAKGIDRYVQEALEDPENKLSKEFSDYDLEPARWSSVDVLRLYMASMTGFMDQEQELKNANIYTELIDMHGEETAQSMFNDIVWLNDPAAPTSSDSDASSGEGTPFMSSSTSDKVAQAAQFVLQRRSNYNQKSNELGIPLKVGSNATIIGPSKSKSGNPIMFGGPQVGFTAPGFIYEVGLHGPDFDIQGSSFIGYPFIMFGATNDFSFTATAGFSDVVDIFEEKLNPENANEYKFDGKWKKFEKRTETFEVKKKNGKTETVTRDFYKSVHGPVIFKDGDNNIAYSKKWAFRGTEAESWAAYLNMNWAENIDEFAVSARDYTMSLNWYYADSEDIAYFHVGQTPVRDERVDWRFPTPGTGEYEWDGFHDMSDNPHEINPDRGYVANWNNKPAPNWNNNEQSFFWNSDSRVQQYIDGIENHEKMDMKDMNDVNYDASFVDLKTRMFKPFLLDVISKKANEGNEYKRAYQLLDDWNNLKEDKDDDKYYDSPAVTIMETWWEQFYANVITKDDFGELLEEVQPMIDPSYGSGLLHHLIQGDESSLKVEHNWIKDQTVEEVAMESFDQALSELEKEYGSSMDKWKASIETMTFGEESLVGVPHGLGDEEPIISMNRGSENHFIEMAPDGPEGMNVTPPGQVGFITQDGKYSQHYRDQVSLFKDFAYKPMLFKKDDVRENAVETEEITFDD